MLRRQTEVGVAPFTAVAGLLAEHPARHALSGRRLGHALCEIARFPQVRRAVGPILARLILAAFDDPARFSGVAHLILAEDAEDREAWAEAAEHFAAAAPALLRDPLPPLLHRALLGDQSLVDGVLPESALSARPHICRARVAIAAGQHAEARAELVIALDLGEEDHETERQAEELKRRLDR